MKKLLKLSFVTILAVLAMGIMSYAANGGGKHHKTAKENKKVYYKTFFRLLVFPFFI